MKVGEKLLEIRGEYDMATWGDGGFGALDTEGHHFHRKMIYVRRVDLVKDRDMDNHHVERRCVRSMEGAFRVYRLDGGDHRSQTWSMMAWQKEALSAEVRLWLHIA